MSNNDEADRTSTWLQPRFVVATLVVALIAVLGVALLITGPADSNDPPPAAAPPTTAPQASPAANSDSTCGLPAGDQTVPRTAPADTKWELVGTIAAPTAPRTHGPGRVSEGLRSCFAHSPTGALYAAVNFAAAVSEPKLQASAVRQLTATGPGRSRALAELEQPQPAGSTGVQVVGFTFLNYADGSATVDLALRAAKNPSNTGLVHAPLTMRWESGDWKAVIPDAGDYFPGIGPVPDLAGYVPWAGT